MAMLMMNPRSIVCLAAILYDKQDAAQTAQAGALYDELLTHMRTQGYEQYRAPTSLTTMVPGTVTNVGGSQAHQNMQPFTVINFMIALVGIFPSQN